MDTAQWWLVKQLEWPTLMPVQCRIIPVPSRCIVLAHFFSPSWGFGSCQYLLADSSVGIKEAKRLIVTALYRSGSSVPWRVELFWQQQQWWHEWEGTLSWLKGQHTYMYWIDTPSSHCRCQLRCMVLLSLDLHKTRCKKCIYVIGLCIRYNCWNRIGHICLCLMCIYGKVWKITRRLVEWCIPVGAICFLRERVAVCQWLCVLMGHANI